MRTKEEEDRLDTIVILLLLLCMLAYLGNTCFTYIKYKRSLRTVAEHCRTPLEENGHANGHHNEGGVDAKND